MFKTNSQKVVLTSLSADETIPHFYKMFALLFFVPTVFLVDANLY